MSLERYGFFRKKSTGVRPVSSRPISNIQRNRSEIFSSGTREKIIPSADSPISTKLKEPLENIFFSPLDQRNNSTSIDEMEMHDAAVADSLRPP